MRKTTSKRGLFKLLHIWDAARKDLDDHYQADRPYMKNFLTWVQRRDVLRIRVDEARRAYYDYKRLYEIEHGK